MVVCLGWIPFNKTKTWGNQTGIEEEEITLEDLPEGKTGYYDSESGFYFTTDDDDENYPFK